MKLLLLPFRIISVLITALGKILVPIAELLRVVIGLFVFFIGLGLVIGVIMSTGILFGIFSGIGLPILWATDVSELSIPLHAFSNAFPTWTVVAAFFGAIIPSIFLLLLGISIIARRVVFNATVGWSMFVVFFLSVAALSVGIPRIVYNFKEHGEHKVEKAFQITGKTAVLRINETGLDDYEGVDLYLRANDDPGFLLVQTFEAQGPTRLKAAENAQMVDYNVTLQDSVFYFDSNLRFKDDAIFRGQQLRMTLYIPYNTPFVIGDGMYRLINQYIGDWSVREGNTWMMTQQGLKCLTCPVEEMDTDQSTYYDRSDSTQDQYGLSGFDELNVSGFVDLRVYQGDEYSV
ncbi:MAG: hypothetical protein HC859_16875, partial [Bacteroidia bacterium]|nr:hypothetical protein [Bacteroidia bacterium]